MANNDDVLIVGSLKDEELRKSINELVEYVDMRTSDMASSFVVSMDMMKGAMKDFAVTQKVSVDLIKQSWREMSASFDAMFKAEKEGAGGGKPTSYDDGTLGALKAENAEIEKKLNYEKLYSNELQQEVDLLTEQKNLVKQQTTSTASAILNSALNKLPTSLVEAEEKLEILEKIQLNYGNTTKLSVAEQNRLTKAIANTKKQIENLKKGTPKTLEEVMGMSEKGIEAITRKMQALKRVTIDPTNAIEVKRLGDEYQKLSRLQSELLGKNIQHTKSNNYLAQSFGYIRNRIVYAMTLGAITNFTKQIYEIRAQYEMLERSLGILIGSFQKGQHVFQELNQMALKSPFTLIELGTAAKQLTAYNFAANEVVDTTRRLADISAALGVPMERLTYNLGQIRAQTVLTARDARDFANAGLPIVKSLSDYFTELEGKVVSTGDVYDRMSKKMVSYYDVMQVLNEMTDEGGKFFNFQAKQAETLKVQLANLSLAWNNMLNDIGSGNQGLLTAPIKGLKALFENWESISRVLSEILIMYGLARTAQYFFNQAISKGTLETIKSTAATQGATAADFKAVISKETLTKAQAKYILQQNLGNRAIRKAVFDTGLLTVQEYKAATAANVLGVSMTKLQVIGQGIGNIFKNIFKNFVLTPQMGIFAIVGAAADWLFYSQQIEERTVALNEAIRTNAKENYDSISKFLTQYQEVYNKINAVDENGQKTDLGTTEAQKTWESVKEAIMQSSSAGEGFVMQLEQIEDVNERIRKGFDYATAIRDANAALLELADTGIKVAQTGWWDWFSDDKGLTDTMRRMNAVIKEGSQDTLDIVKEKLEADKANLDEYLQSIADDFGNFARENLVDLNTTNLEDYKNSVLKIREAFELVVNEIATSEKLTKSETQQLRRLLEKQVATLDIAYKNPQAWRESFGEARASTEEFLDWLQNTNQAATTKMYKGMTQAQIDSIDMSDEKWRKWIDDMLNNFKKGHEEAYQDLKDYVSRGNLLKIFIPIHFGLAQQANWLKQLLGEKGLDAEKYETAGITSLDDFIEKQKKIANTSKKELERLAKAGVTLDTAATEEEKQHIQEVTNSYKQANAAVKAFNASLKEGKSGGSKKDVLGDALQKEVQVISEIQKRFKEYRNMGVNAQDALELSAKEYNKTLLAQNGILSKFGINTLKVEQISTMSLQNIRDFYQDQIKGVTTSEKGIEALEKAIASLNVEIEKTDYKKITDGLNNELNKLKDEYELSVELDANPELGNMFVDMFDIDLNDLPDNIDKYAGRIIEAFNRAFEKQKKDFRLTTLDLTEDDLNEYKIESQKEVGAISEEDYKNIEKYAKMVRDLRKKDREETLKQTKELQYKLSDANGKIAFEEEKLAQLRIKLDKEVNEEKRKLLELQIKEQENVIAKLGEEVMQLLPTYKKLYDSIAEHSAVITRKIAQQWKEALVKAKPNMDGTYTITDPQSGERATITQKEWGKQLGRVNAKLRETQSSFAKIKEAFTKGEDGEIDFAKGLELVAQEAQKAVEGIRAIAEIISSLGGSDDAVETLNDIATSIEGIATASTGVAQITSGDIIGGSVNVIKGSWSAVSTWFDNSNKKITKNIERSEMQVKQLELAYIHLEHAIENSYGMATIGAQKAAIANKELQLAELERQLALEQSRKSKDKDQDKIIDLKKQIQELKYEIKGMTDEIVNDLLGISSVGDAMENLMDGFIEALRNGEDAMKVFKDTTNDMIANMVKKMYVTKILQPWFEEQWNKIEESIMQRAQQEQQNIKYMSDEDIRKKLAQEKWYEYNGTWNFGDFRLNSYMESITQEQIDNYKKAAEDALVKATTPTTEDIKRYAELLRSGQPVLEENMVEIQEFLRQLGLLNDTKNNQLSALQQGIQGITEDTAGALEAYMNIVSQKMFEQNAIMIEIRDTVQSFELDTQVGTLAEMLVQLQQSYIVQQSIESMLRNVLNPTERAICVELIS